MNLDETFQGNCRTFPIGQTAEEVRDSSHVVLPFPYDLPPPRYQKGGNVLRIKQNWEYSLIFFIFFRGEMCFIIGTLY